jgi:HK97 gp10 family phage protein
MADSKVVIGSEELTRKFRAMGEAVQEESLVGAVQVGGLVILNAAKDNIKDQGLIRTHHLSRSLHMEVSERSATKAAVDVGTNLESAAIHEFGGVIKAKNVKYLAIPVGSYTGSPLKYSDLSVRKTGNGNLILVDASNRVQYVLKASVQIPARPYMRPAMDEHGIDAQNEMGEAFKALVMKAATT